jgi:hypothetical protein
MQTRHNLNQCLSAFEFKLTHYQALGFVDISPGFGHKPTTFRGILGLLGWQAGVEVLHFA